MAEGNVWQATEARSRLPKVLQAALSGQPQVIRRRSGEEVVVLFDLMQRPPPACGRA